MWLVLSLDETHYCCFSLEKMAVSLLHQAALDKYGILLLEQEVSRCEVIIKEYKASLPF